MVTVNIHMSFRITEEEYNSFGFKEFLREITSGEMKREFEQPSKFSGGVTPRGMKLCYTINKK